MGIFNRIADIFKANVNEALDKAEDPEKMIKQMVIEMEESVNKATLSVAQAIANQNTLKKKLEKAKKEVSEWQSKAEQAIIAGRDDLAKAALEKKKVAQRNVQDLEPTFKQAEATANKLRNQLDELKKKLDEARSRKSTLIARSNAAKAEKTLNQSASGMGSSAFSKFDKYEQKVETMEAEAEAFGELSGDDKDLDEEFKELNSTDIDDELSQLKKKLNK